MANSTPSRVLTAGHSTRAIEEFIALLVDADVELLVDVRRFPGSRRFPHFNTDRLAAALEVRGIAYRHCEPLGGRRSGLGDASPNMGWRNASFRAFADHMQTAEFEAAADALAALARSRRAAIMCSEAVPWRCHRQLIADALVARGIEVHHLLGGGSEPHALPEFARIEGTRVTYPRTKDPPQGRLLA